MIPPELAPYLPEILTAIAALFVGWLFTHLAASGRIAAGREMLKAEERRSAEAEARLARAIAEVERGEQDARTFRSQLAELRSRLDSETKSASAGQAMLERAEARLENTFKALASDLLRPVADLREQVRALGEGQNELRRGMSSLASSPDRGRWAGTAQRPELPSHAPAPEPATAANLALDPGKSAKFLEPEFEDDFTFVPNPPASARSAAADLRSAVPVPPTRLRTLPESGFHVESGFMTEKG
jgi:hypothetical protein